MALVIVDDLPTSWNPLDKEASVTLSNENLTVEAFLGYYGGRATRPKGAGKWYFEYTIDRFNSAMVGVCNSLMSLSYGYGSNATMLYQNGYLYNTTEGTWSTMSYKLGDTIGVSFDADSRMLMFYINGVKAGTPINMKFSGAVYPAFFVNGSKMTANFGATPFKYAPPDGYIGFDVIKNTRRFPQVWVGGV